MFPVPMPGTTAELIGLLDRHVPHPRPDAVKIGDLAKEEVRLELAMKAGARGLVDHLIEKWRLEGNT